MLVTVSHFGKSPNFKPLSFVPFTSHFFVIRPIVSMAKLLTYVQNFKLSIDINWLIGAFSFICQLPKVFLTSMLYDSNYAPTQCQNRARSRREMFFFVV